MSESEDERIRRVYRTYMPAVTRYAGDNRGNQAIAEEREKEIHALLTREGLQPVAERRILDLGCGMGQTLATLKRAGAAAERLTGIDLLPERVEICRRQHPDVQLSCQDATQLSFEDGSFDLVMVFTVFSSILDDATSAAVATEMNRVLKPGGGIIWYDLRYDNPSNPNVRGISRRGIAGLFPGYDLRLGTITLLPPLARRLGPLVPVLYPLLRLFPPLRSHHFGLLVRP